MEGQWNSQHRRCCTRGEHRPYSCPAREKAQRGAPDAQREIDEGVVSAHRYPAIRGRYTSNGFQAEAREHERKASARDTRSDNGSPSGVCRVDQSQPERLNAEAIERDTRAAEAIRKTAADDTRKDQRNGKRGERCRSVCPAARYEIKREEGCDRAECDAAQREADPR
jgi:hypothetical protein